MGWLWDFYKCCYCNQICKISKWGGEAFNISRTHDQSDSSTETFIKCQFSSEVKWGDGFYLSHLKSKLSSRGHQAKKKKYGWNMVNMSEPWLTMPSWLAFYPSPSQAVENMEKFTLILLPIFTHKPVASWMAISS